jgi:DNA topoisomerase VI subunit A
MQTTQNASNRIASKVYVHGSVHRESMSIIAQQDATMYSLLHFCKLLALHVSGGNSTNHQENITVITASGCVQTAPRQRKVAETV